MTKNGETNLSLILKTLSPELNPGSYVFCCVSENAIPKVRDIIGTFREAEGITVILKKETADVLGLEYGVVMSWITLNVHSSLEAVGLTAAFSKALAEAGLGCNVVAGLYHDHIFTPEIEVQKAFTTLRNLAK